MAPLVPSILFVFSVSFRNSRCKAPCRETLRKIEKLNYSYLKNNSFMDLMNTPQYLITDYLNKSFSEGADLEALRKTLFEKGVFTKDYLEDGLMLLYHKFDCPVKTELERECRSLIIDRSTLKIKSYSCETPRTNKEGMDYLISHSTELQLINPCYEGTFLSVFFHNDKWYVSTRRCLDSRESIFKELDDSESISHYDMFEEIVKKAGYADFSEFSKLLDTSKSYYFVLIHLSYKFHCICCFIAHANFIV